MKMVELESAKRFEELGLFPDSEWVAVSTGGFTRVLRCGRDTKQTLIGPLPGLEEMLDYLRDGVDDGFGGKERCWIEPSGLCDRGKPPYSLVFTVFVTQHCYHRGGTVSLTADSYFKAAEKAIIYLNEGK